MNLMPNRLLALFYRLYRFTILLSYSLFFCIIFFLDYAISKDKAIRHRPFMTVTKRIVKQEGEGNDVTSNVVKVIFWLL